MTIIKVSEATGPALDWLVAKCEGHDTAFTPAGDVLILREGITDYFDPHRNWGWGGPIKQKKKIISGPSIDGRFLAFIATPPKQENTPSSFGDTELIAAMRCIVLSHYGEVVDVPDELI